MTRRVLHLSTYSGGGGAARAAHALHTALQSTGVDSRMISAHGPRFHAARAADRALWRLQRSPLQTWRSPARFASITADQINRSSADVVNLHWITDGFLSIEEIGRIEKPVVWSMYDMWPFTGTEHYCAGTTEARWRTGYTKLNRTPDDHGFDLDRWTYDRKQHHWPREGTSIHMVPASSWLEQATRESALMHEYPITRIPHVVDTDVFAPMSKEVARQRLGLPQDSPIILFLASAGIADKRKGFDLLEQTLPELIEAHPNLSLAIAGPVTSDYQPPTNIPIHWLGRLNGDGALRLAYCAADVLAAPSREDNMPLTAMEAQSCGTQVVAFNIGGLPDIVAHNITGHLALAGDIASLTWGLDSAIQDAQGEEAWGNAARLRAIETWSNSRVVDRYTALYQQISQEGATRLA